MIDAEDCDRGIGVDLRFMEYAQAIQDVLEKDALFQRQRIRNFVDIGLLPGHVFREGGGAVGHVGAVQRPAGAALVAHPAVRAVEPDHPVPLRQPLVIGGGTEFFDDPRAGLAERIGVGDDHVSAQIEFEVVRREKRVLNFHEDVVWIDDLWLREGR